MIASSLALALVMAVYCTWRFKNYTNMISFVQGKSLAVAKTEVTFGTTSKGADPVIEIPIANLTSGPIEVVGARVTCSCLDVENVPFALPPGESRSLRIRVVTSRKKGKVGEKVTVYTNSKTQPQIRLNVTGFVQSEEQAVNSKL